MKPPKELQPINHEMNLLGGFNLNKIHRYHVDFPDPPQGYGGLFMDRASVDSVRHSSARRRPKGWQGTGFYGYLYQADSGSRALFDMWGESGRELFDKQVAATLEEARNILDDFVNGRGIFGFMTHYWHGGNRMARQLIYFDQLLCDPRCTPEQSTKLKAAAVMFGSIMCDNDFVPLDNYKGFNMGNANMPLQMSAMRESYAMFLASHPAFADRAKRVIDDALPRDLQWVFDENGVVAQSPHYAGASVVPTLNLMAMVQQRGEDPVQGSERASKFGEFYMNLLTPPEPRVFKGGLYEGRSSAGPVR